MMRRLFVVLCALIAIAGCAPRAALTLDPVAATVGQVRPVFVATTRGPDPADPVDFGPTRTETVQFARFDVAVPPDRKPGEVAWPRPGARPDPRRQFLVTDAQRYAGPGPFGTALSRTLASLPADRREVVIFVHGFNTTFAEGLYRTAQIGHDLEVPGVLVHYAWPSRANPLGYAHDRDSALFARDGLESLVTAATRDGATRVIVIAHSMGASLAMETLRQMAIAGNRRTLDRIGGVVLISPDIDVDVFHAQAARIGHLPQPFVIFTSKRDRALALSARLTGQRDRLGNIKSIDRLADLDVTLLDVSAYSSGLGHFVPAKSAALIRLLNRVSELDRALALERAGRAGLLPGVVLTVRDATQVILSPVAVIGGAG